MRIIFLDIDGVLNDCAAPDGTEGLYFVQEHLIRKLNWLIAESGAMCVLSSTWKRRWPVPAVQMFLEKHGFTGKVIDSTPYMPHSERGEEIAMWLKLCRECGLDIESWVILDDASDMGPLLPWLVQTDPDDGLTDEDVEKALELLEATNG